MELKTDATKRGHRYTLFKRIKNISAVSLFAVVSHSYSQVDSCSAQAYFTLATADYKNVTITNLSTGSNLSYQWSFGDGTSSTAVNPGTHTYASSGTHYVVLHLTDVVKNCSSNYADTIGIPCSAGFSWIINQDDVTFTANTAMDPATTTYAWNFGDGTTSTSQSPEHTFPSPQYYNVCLTVTSKTGLPCSDNYCGIVNVNISNHCNAFYTIHPDSSTTDPYDFLIFNQSSGLNLDYLWHFGDGTTSTLSNPTHDYAGTGPYVICLTVSNDSCKNTYCDTLDLSDTVHHLLPGKFHVTVVNKTTGIKKNDMDKATLTNYPNPFNRTTTISYSVSTSSRVELAVYNLLGVKVDAIEIGTKAAGNYTLDWDAQHLQEGIYLLQLKANDQLITKKIMLTK
jgi:PKD repeat protein